MDPLLGMACLVRGLQPNVRRDHVDGPVTHDRPLGFSIQAASWRAEGLQSCARRTACRTRGSWSCGEPARPWESCANIFQKSGLTNFFTTVSQALLKLRITTFSSPVRGPPRISQPGFSSAEWNVAAVHRPLHTIRRALTTLPTLQVLAARQRLSMRERTRC